ncbi:MAG: hypothetical protein ACHBN1_30380 [Heteroscytonema crispum UTEX LB 1556]|uniref:Orf24 n=1 Tax=Heteroscytonema crispum UCFS15 TaxID=1123969 RepID=A0A3G2KSN8_9CYAN|nr:Orf24 [Heteroscytonema crispum UCFS15]
MINLEQFRQEMEDWIINVVSIPNPLTGNFPPCPYAKAAWLNNRVSLRWFHGPELPELLMEQIKTWNDDFEMVLFGCDPQNLDAQRLKKYITEANYVLQEYDLIALASPHPDEQYIANNANNVNDVIISHPKYVFAIVQSLSRLQEASDELLRLGYFQYWSEEKLAGVNRRRELVKKLSSSQRKNIEAAE